MDLNILVLPCGAAASLRMYFECLGDVNNLGRGPTIPVGSSHFPKEVVVFPAAYVSSNFTAMKLI